MKRDYYLCCRCGNPAEEVHHKIRLTPGNIMDPNITLNEDNLESLCKDCHFAEHKADKMQGIRGKSNSTVCAEEYEFDSNGYLVRKILPPSN